MGTSLVRCLSSGLTLTLLLICGAAAPGTVTDSEVASKAEIQADLAKVPCRNKDRLAAVQELFVKMGARAEDLTVAHFKRADNLVLTIKGKAEGFIVVGAHYDKVEAGCGAVDNWTGIVILAYLYRTMRTTLPTKTILFVAFGQEESGLVGSQAMVEAIPKKDLSSYCSMVNMDSFGFARPQLLENVSTRKLAAFASKVARENQVPFASAEIANADADSASFKKKGVPAVTLHGLANDWETILDTKNDQLARIKVDSVYLGYRFALLLIDRLDASDCEAFR
jgi:Peptidase family M28